MMRTIDQDGGLKVYIERLVENMLRLDPDGAYTLIYRTPKHLGRFAGAANATELLVTAPHKLLWDQISVPYTAWRRRCDIIFNPKFSVPFVSHCPVAMSLREPAWWAWPEHYPGWNARFMRLTIPAYVARSSVLFPISQFVHDECRKYLRLEGKRVIVGYPAPDARFRPVDDVAEMERARRQYGLPERFILGAARVEHPGIEETDAFFPGKNVETTVRAYNLCRERIPHRLVLAGRRVRDYLLHVGLSETEIEGITFLDFVPHQDMVLLHNLAEMAVLPSYYESFAHFLVEAMCCGTPVVASRTGACPEISGGAALLADPDDPSDFADKMLQIATDSALSDDLSGRGLKRAAEFSWARTARTILQGLYAATGRTFA